MGCIVCKITEAFLLFFTSGYAWLSQSVDRMLADFGSQDCYDIPRTFPSDKTCSFDFNESFNSYFVSVVDSYRVVPWKHNFNISTASFFVILERFVLQAC